MITEALRPHLTKGTVWFVCAKHAAAPREWSWHRA